MASTSFGVDEILIAPTAQTARTLLVSCQKLLIEDQDTHRIANTQLNRFDLWASNIGVFSSRHSSLDYRLRTAPTAKAAIDGNLEILCKHALGILAGRTTLTDDELDAFADLDSRDIPTFATNLYEQNRFLATADTRNVQNSLLHRIDESIGVLHRLSLAIRKASSRHTIARLPQLVTVDEGYRWGKSAQDLLSGSGVVVNPISFDATTTFEDFIRRVLQSRWLTTDAVLMPNSATKHYREVMLQRCVAAISARRCQLTYFQRHQAKLANAQTAVKVSDALPVVASDLRGTQSSSKLQVPLGSNQASKSFARDEPQPASHRTLSETVPLVFKVESFCPPPSTSAPSSAGTGSSAGGLGSAGPFEIPPAPEIASIEKEKMCPYCCIVYPAKTFSPKQRSRRWRKHLLDDLQPYVCLYEKCEQAGTTYRSFRSWQTHLNKAHTQRWVCTIPHESGDFMDEDRIFETADEFEAHVSVSHRDTDPSKLHSLTQNASQRATPPQWCFVCMAEQSSEITLQQHVAKHLETAFILSLPPRDDVKDSSGLSSGRPSGGSGGSHGQLPDDVAISNIQDLFPENGRLERVQPGRSLTVTELEKHVYAHDMKRDPSLEMARFLNQDSQLQPEMDKVSAPATQLEHLDRRWKLALRFALFVGKLSYVGKVSRRKRSIKIQWRWKYAYAYLVLQTRFYYSSEIFWATFGLPGPYFYAAYKFLSTIRSKSDTVYRTSTRSAALNMQRRRDVIKRLLALAVLVSWKIQATSWKSARGDSKRHLEVQAMVWHTGRTSPGRHYGSSIKALGDEPRWEYSLANNQKGRTEGEQFYQEHHLKPAYRHAVTSPTSNLKVMLFLQEEGSQSSLKTLQKAQVESSSLLLPGYVLVQRLFRIRANNIGSNEEFLPEYLRRYRVVRRWQFALAYSLKTVGSTLRLPISGWTVLQIHLSEGSVRAKRRSFVRRRLRIFMIAAYSFLSLYERVVRRNLNLRYPGLLDVKAPAVDEPAFAMFWEKFKRRMFRFNRSPRRRWIIAIIAVRFIIRLPAPFRDQGRHPVPFFIARPTTSSPSSNSDIIDMNIPASDTYKRSVKEAVGRIAEMGFTAHQAREALRLTDIGDGPRVDRALELLLERQQDRGIDASFLAIHRWRVLLIAINFTIRLRDGMRRARLAGQRERHRLYRSTEPIDAGTQGNPDLVDASGEEKHVKLGDLHPALGARRPTRMQSPPPSGEREVFLEHQPSFPDKDSWSVYTAKQPLSMREQRNRGLAHEGTAARASAEPSPKSTSSEKPQNEKQPTEASEAPLTTVENTSSLDVHKAPFSGLDSWTVLSQVAIAVIRFREAARRRRIARRRIYHSDVDAILRRLRVYFIAITFIGTFIKRLHSKHPATSDAWSSLNADEMIKVRRRPARDLAGVGSAAWAQGPISPTNPEDFARDLDATARDNGEHDETHTSPLLHADDEHEELTAGQLRSSYDTLEQQAARHIWYCKRCGEGNPGNLHHCWSCRTARIH